MLGNSSRIFLRLLIIYILGWSVGTLQCGLSRIPVMLDYYLYFIACNRNITIKFCTFMFWVMSKVLNVCDVKNCAYLIINIVQ